MSATAAYIGLGSNLGDRQAFLAEALAGLRRLGRLVAVSDVYETEPEEVEDQPAYLNMAAVLATQLPPDALMAALLELERQLGRRRDPDRPKAPRSLDLDLLFYGDVVMRTPGLTLPHPAAHRRAFVLVPLLDVAPELVHPETGQTVADLARRVDAGTVKRLPKGLLAGFARDVQAEPPERPLALDRVGVTGLERVVQIESGHPVTTFHATLDIYVHLAADRKGTHMSRFPDLVDEAVDELARQPSPDVESLAGRIAAGIRTRQGAMSAECSVKARVPRTRYAPVSGIRTQDLFTLIGWASSGPAVETRLVGVEVEGITVCPCAQDMVRAHASQRLLESGFDADQSDKVLSLVPLASHSQRSRGRLLVSALAGVSADNLVHIVEGAMSSEIYSLLKRPDELFVVQRAHRRPRFVEDAVREMLGRLLDAYPTLPDDAFAAARQTNFESIHGHDVTAERAATFGALRAEVAGVEAPAESHASGLPSRLSFSRFFEEP